MKVAVERERPAMTAPAVARPVQTILWPAETMAAEDPVEAVKKNKAVSVVYAVLPNAITRNAGEMAVAGVVVFAKSTKAAPHLESVSALPNLSSAPTPAAIREKFVPRTPAAHRLVDQTTVDSRMGAAASVRGVKSFKMPSKQKASSARKPPVCLWEIHSHARPFPSMTAAHAPTPMHVP